MTNKLRTVLKIGHLDYPVKEFEELANSARTVINTLELTMLWHAYYISKNGNSCLATVTYCFEPLELGRTENLYAAATSFNLYSCDEMIDRLENLVGVRLMRIDPQMQEILPHNYEKLFAIAQTEAFEADRDYNAKYLD